MSKIDRVFKATAIQRDRFDWDLSDGEKLTVQIEQVSYEQTRRFGAVYSAYVYVREGEGPWRELAKVRWDLNDEEDERHWDFPQGPTVHHANHRLAADLLGGAHESARLTKGLLRDLLVHWHEQVMVTHGTSDEALPDPHFYVSKSLKKAFVCRGGLITLRHKNSGRKGVKSELRPVPLRQVRSPSIHNEHLVAAEDPALHAEFLLRKAVLAAAARRYAKKHDLPYGDFGDVKDNAGRTWRDVLEDDES